MATQSKKNEPGKKQQYCSYCDYRGIIINPHYQELGEEPIMPCPKCILSECTCDAREPYFVLENDAIKKCFCRDTRLKITQIKGLYEHSRIDKKYLWRFINDYESGHKLAQKARSEAYDIIMKFPNVKKGLFFWGNPGTGKTLLSSIILTELITRYAVDGRFIKISRTLFNRLKATFVEGSAQYGDASRIEQKLADVDVLVLDDFGVQRDSAWEQETLYNLVDARYEGEKFTIFTSNNNPYKTLANLSEGRVLSRIKEMCKIIEISGPDYRDNM